MHPVRQTNPAKYFQQGLCHSTTTDVLQWNCPWKSCAHVYCRDDISISIRRGTNRSNQVDTHYREWCPD